MSPFTPDSLPDLSGRVYVVTGGNTGLYVYHSTWIAITTMANSYLSYHLSHTTIIHV